MRAHANANGIEGVSPGVDGMGNPARQEMMLRVQALAAAQARRN